MNETLAILVGWLRLAAPAVFAVALANLVDVAQLLGGADGSALQSEQLGAKVMASIASFDNGWEVSLAIFGLHLLGLGFLLFRSAHHQPRPGPGGSPTATGETPSTSGQIGDRDFP